MESEDIYIDSYRLVTKLGSGAFGIVYLAQHAILTDRFVAIKLIYTLHLGSSQEIARFLAEAQFLEKLKHPYISSFIDAGTHEGFPYFVTEYAPKGSLRDRLGRQPRGPLPLGEAITILTQVGEALQYAHQQDIIHRDLKSENILFNETGDALLTDFGIAALLSTEDTKQAMKAGTLTYMAPEQIHDITSKESDQYALACIAYELFTGHMPFPNYDALVGMHFMGTLIPPTIYNPQLPKYIEQAILKAMSRRSTNRYIDVSTFIKALSTPTSHPRQRTREEWMLEFTAIPRIYPGDKYKIIDACERATQLDSTNSLAWLYKGGILKHFGRLEEAQEAYKIASKLGYSEDEDPDTSDSRNDVELLEPFKQVNNFDVISADAFNGKGIEFEQMKHYRAALQAYEQAILLNPNLTSAWRNKAHMLLRLNRHTKALEACEHAIQLNPYYAPVYTVKGLTLHGLGHHEEALTAYEKAIKLDSNIPEAHMSKGHVLYDLHRFDEALGAYEYAIQLDHTNALAYYGKGMSLSMLDCYNESIVTFDQAILLKSDFADAFRSKGVALFNLKRYAEALAAFEHFIQLDPYKTFAWLYKGNILLELNFYNEALTAFEEATRLNPNAAGIYFFKGVALDYLKRYEEALAAFELAIQLDSSHIDAYNAKGAILAKIGYHKEALLTYEQAIEINPNNVNVWFNKGKSLFEMRRYEEALAAFERAIHLAPKYINAYIDKGTARSLLKRHNEALTIFDQAIQLDPPNADAYNGKGNPLYSLNRYNKALIAVEQAIKLDPNEAIFQNNRGNVLQRFGRFNEAQQAYERVKQLEL